MLASLKAELAVNSWLWETIYPLAKGGKRADWLIQQMTTSEGLLLVINWDGADSLAAWQNVLDLESSSVPPGAVAMATAGVVG